LCGKKGEKWQEKYAEKVAYPGFWLAKNLGIRLNLGTERVNIRSKIEKVLSAIYSEKRGDNKGERNWGRGCNGRSYLLFSNLNNFRTLGNQLHSRK